MLKQRTFQKHPRLTLFVTVITLSVLVLSGFEATLYLFLKFPQLNNYFPYFKSTVTSVYFSRDRNILQFMPECARYDDELAYTLKPGEFDFCNREYCNHYSVNSMGLRDDEASLHQPELIVLGDSYALGWGVEQGETFEQIIEKQTGRKALNAGVSSYGTAREVLLLNRLDTTRLKYLVIQYSENDFLENQDYAARNFHLDKMTKEEYEGECRKHASVSRKYFPLMFTTFFAREIKKKFEEKFSRKIQDTDESVRSLPAALSKMDSQNISSPDSGNVQAPKLFLEILSHSQARNVPAVVLNLSHHTLDTRSFIQHLDLLKESGDYSLFIRKMKLIDASSFLDKNDYYIIDDHLNASGHRKVADAIMKAINEN